MALAVGTKSEICVWAIARAWASPATQKNQKGSAIMLQGRHTCVGDRTCGVASHAEKDSAIVNAWRAYYTVG